MNKLIVALLVASMLSGCQTVPYQQAEKHWNSYQDLALWLQRNFRFDRYRQREVLKTLRESGPEAVSLRSPEEVYRDGGGYCADAANFVYQNLKRINSDYNPSFVFIQNSMGRPNHWVTAFYVQGKLYIMDYGTGMKWSAMQGVYGPYEDLSEYAAYLRTLDLPGFAVGRVYFRDFPGMMRK